MTTVIAACAHDSSDTVPDTEKNFSLRVIVSFATEKSIWADSDLSRLRESLVADIEPIATVSDIAWVYTVRTKPGQSSATLFQALLSRPEVRQVELDRLVKNP